MKYEFLSLLTDARKNQTSREEQLNYETLYRLAHEHQVSPLIYNQIYAFHDFPVVLKENWKKEAIQMNYFQTIRTQRLLLLYKEFLKANLKVLIVKGVILRSLYPQPENRTSNDEDLYIEKKDFDKTKEILLNQNFFIVKESEDETTFFNQQSGLSIELHTALFSKESKAYGRFQTFFDQAFVQAIVHEIDGVPVYSLSHDLHFLFLFLHFTKHFLHGGVGIRQILDIVMYCEAYGQFIDWQRIYDVFHDMHVFVLMKNVFALAHQYLDFDLNSIVLPEDYHEEDYDFEDLLDDIMDAGIFGQSSEERVHSSTMTLNAVNGGKTKIWRSVFPTFMEMKGKYDYLTKYPFLLPIAYFSRIWGYFQHNSAKEGQKTIEIGQKRIDLLKKYQLIEK